MLQFTVRNRYESLRSNYSIRANLIGGRRKQESTMDGQREDRDFLGQYTHRLRRDTRPASYLFSPFSPRFIRSTGGRVACVRACVSSAQHRPTTRAIAPNEIAARVSSLETVKTFADPYGPRTKQKRKQREREGGEGEAIDVEPVAVALPSIIG